jgi:hypothetical protein
VPFIEPEQGAYIHVECKAKPFDARYSQRPAIRFSLAPLPNPGPWTILTGVLTAQIFQASASQRSQGHERRPTLGWSKRGIKTADISSE